MLDAMAPPRHQQQQQQQQQEQQQLQRPVTPVAVAETDSGGGGRDRGCDEGRKSNNSCSRSTTSSSDTNTSITNISDNSSNSSGSGSEASCTNHHNHNNHNHHHLHHNNHKDQLLLTTATTATPTPATTTDSGQPSTTASSSLSSSSSSSAAGAHPISSSPPLSLPSTHSSPVSPLSPSDQQRLPNHMNPDELAKTLAEGEQPSADSSVEAPTIPSTSHSENPQQQQQQQQPQQALESQHINDTADTHESATNEEATSDNSSANNPQPTSNAEASTSATTNPTTTAQLQPSTSYHHQQQHQHQHHHHHHQTATPHNHHHNSYQPSPRFHSSHHNSNTMSYAARSSNQRGHNSNQHQQHQKYHHHPHHHYQQPTAYAEQQQQQQQQQQHQQVPPVSAADLGATTSRSPQQMPAVPPNEVTHSGPPHYVDLHVNPGECISLKLMNGHEQVVPGPATIKMISQLQNPPVPLPIQAPYGHMIHQVADENGILRHIVLSIMGTDENGAQHDSTVINFPQGPFRIDSHGQLVSISNNSGGGGAAAPCSSDGTASVMQAPLSTLPQQVYFANYDGCPIAYDTTHTTAGQMAQPDPSQQQATVVGGYGESQPPHGPLPGSEIQYHSLGQGPTPGGEMTSPLSAHHNPYKSHPPVVPSPQMLASGSHQQQPMPTVGSYPTPAAAYGPQVGFDPAQSHPHQHSHHHVPPVSATMANVVSSSSGKQLINNPPAPTYGGRTPAINYAPPDDQTYHASTSGSQRYSVRHHDQGGAAHGPNKDKRYQSGNVKVITSSSSSQQQQQQQQLGVNNPITGGPLSPHRHGRGGRSGSSGSQAAHHMSGHHHSQHSHHNQWIGIRSHQHQHQQQFPTPDEASHPAGRHQSKSYAYHANQSALPVTHGSPGKHHHQQHIANQQAQPHYYAPAATPPINSPTTSGGQHSRSPRTQQLGAKPGSGGKQKGPAHSGAYNVPATVDVKYHSASSVEQPPEDPTSVSHQAADQPLSRFSRGKQKKCQNLTQQPGAKGSTRLQSPEGQSADRSAQQQQQQGSSGKDLSARPGSSSLTSKQQQVPSADGFCYKGTEGGGARTSDRTIVAESSEKARVEQKGTKQSNEKMGKNKKNRQSSSATSTPSKTTGGSSESSKRSETSADLKAATSSKVKSAPEQQQTVTTTTITGDEGEEASCSNLNRNSEKEHQQQQIGQSQVSSGSNNRELTSSSTTTITAGAVEATQQNNNEVSPAHSDTSASTSNSQSSTRRDSTELPMALKDSDHQQESEQEANTSGATGTSSGRSSSGSCTTTSKQQQRRGSAGKQSAIKVSDASATTPTHQVSKGKKASPARDVVSSTAAEPRLPKITVSDRDQVAEEDEDEYEILTVTTSCETSEGLTSRDLPAKSSSGARVTVTMRTSLSENNIKSLQDKQSFNLHSSAKSTQTSPVQTAPGKGTSGLSSSHSSSSVSNQEHQQAAGKKKVSSAGDKKKTSSKVSTSTVAQKRSSGKQARNSLDATSSDSAATSQYHSSSLLASGSATSSTLPGYRTNSASSHNHNTNHSSGSISAKTLSQPIRYSFRQCRNRIVTMLGNLVRNSLSSYSDTRFAGLLLVIFTIFAMLLAISIHLYISE